MIATSLLPRPWRRALIDAVYGAEDDKGLKIYLGALWGGLLLLALILTGFTPWAWPAVREGRVEAMAPITCEEILGESEDRPSAATPAVNKSRSKAKTTSSGTGGTRSACRQALTDGERAQLGRAEELVAYLQRGGMAPPPLAIPAGTPVREWIDSNVCRLGGAGAGERGALAWHVWQGVGECSAGTRLMAQLPLSILLSPWVGVILTPLILLWLAFRLLQHSLRMPATRRAYRRLYGSEHKAP